MRNGTPSGATASVASASDNTRPRGRHLGQMVARIEVRRTGTVWVAAGLCVLGTVLLLAKQPPFAPYGNWSSTWADAAGWLSVVGLVLGPLVGAVAAWVAGRETRHGMGDLLTTTARPAAQRALTTWWAVLVGVLSGFLLYATVVAVAVAPAVAYPGGRWVGSWWLVALGWVLCAGIGYAAGRRIPGRLVAPAVGIAVYVGSGIPTYINSTWIQLMPVGQLASSGGYQLIGWVIPAASVWLLAATATALALALGDRRIWLSAAVAIAAAVTLTLGTGGDEGGFAGASWMEPDPGATDLVCTNDGAPKVCLIADHAGLLMAVSPVARQLLAAPLSGMDRAVEVKGDRMTPAPAGTLPLPNLAGHFQAFTDRLDDPAAYLELAAFDLTTPRCNSTSGDDAFFTDVDAQTANMVAISLLTGDPPPPDGPAAALFEQLSNDPDAATLWMSDYTQAANTCDVPDLSRLGRDTQ